MVVGPRSVVAVSATTERVEGSPIRCLEPQVMAEYLQFLRALLGASEGTLHDLRFRHPSNAEQMRHVPAKARQLWEVRAGSRARNFFLFH